MTELFDFPKVDYVGGKKGLDFLDTKGYNYYNPDEEFTINGETTCNCKKNKETTDVPTQLSIFDN